MTKVAALVSGGVDSSLALKLLQQAGHEVTAFYLKIWLEDELTYLNQCPWEEDLSYLRPLCQKAGVTLEVLPMQRDYFERVVSLAIEEVRHGRTPNPDIFCNKNIKFGLFLDSISGFDLVASGHYAQTFQTSQGNWVLRETPDPIKDQTYFLSYLPPNRLPKLAFPIGHLTKAEVRRLAGKLDLPSQNRKDSQGICFLGKFKYKDFLKHYLGTKIGRLVEYETRKVLGNHQGFWFYTLGQRENIGLSGGPWYVVSKNPVENIVFISNNYQQLPRKTVKVSKLNWFQKPDSSSAIQVKLRHGPNKHACRISHQADDNLVLELENNDQGIAEGQFAAFYQDNLCLGAGVISSLDPETL